MESETLEKDPVKAFHSDYEKNLTDSREYLKSIFSTAADVENNQSAEYRKLFPNAEGQKETGHPLLKVARQQFFNSIKIAGLSPLYSELAFRAFCDEMGKIIK